MEFHQSLVNDVVEDTEELILKVRGQGQDHTEVKYLSELLLRADAYTLTFGRRSIIQGCSGF